MTPDTDNIKTGGSAPEEDGFHHLPRSPQGSESREEAHRILWLIFEAQRTGVIEGMRKSSE